MKISLQIFNSINLHLNVRMSTTWTLRDLLFEAELQQDAYLLSNHQCLFLYLLNLSLMFHLWGKNHLIMKISQNFPTEKVSNILTVIILIKFIKLGKKIRIRSLTKNLRGRWMIRIDFLGKLLRKYSLAKNQETKGNNVHIKLQCLIIQILKWPEWNRLQDEIKEGFLDNFLLNLSAINLSQIGSLYQNQRKIL